MELTEDQQLYSYYATFRICRVTVTCASGSHTVRHIVVSAAGMGFIVENQWNWKIYPESLLIVCSLLPNALVPVVSTCEFSVIINNIHSNDYGNL
jgi:hypothetical protein